MCVCIYIYNIYKEIEIPHIFLLSELGKLHASPVCPWGVYSLPTGWQRPPFDSEGRLQVCRDRLPRGSVTHSEAHSVRTRYMVQVLQHNHLWGDLGNTSGSPLATSTQSEDMPPVVFEAPSVQPCLGRTRCRRNEETVSTCNSLTNFNSSQEVLLCILALYKISTK